jgi:hypothetical protein
MAAQYKPKKPMAAAVALQRPTVTNEFVNLKMANYAKTCCVCIFTTKRTELHINRNSISKAKSTQHKRMLQ